MQQKTDPNKWKKGETLVMIQYGWDIKRDSEEEEFFTTNQHLFGGEDGTQIVLELELTDLSITLEDVQIRFPAAASSRQGKCSHLSTLLIGIGR